MELGLVGGVGGESRWRFPVPGYAVGPGTPEGCRRGDGAGSTYRLRDRDRRVERGAVRQGARTH
ncbi:hypothetical protein AB0R12_39855, partial [Streptomyces niveus]|uniref:hypothetical protein n=1 Tax=Streptomyces niveus TaxID=193462 RepID=UPI003429118C